MMIPDMAAGQVSIKLGAKGINSCTVTACATGTNSIGDAFKVIQRGDADAMVTGGTEAPITKMAVAGFCANTALRQIQIQIQQADHLMQTVMALLSVKVQGLLYLEELEHALRSWCKNLCRNCWIWGNR